MALSIGTFTGFTNGSDPTGNASIDSGTTRKFALLAMGETDLSSLSVTVTVGGQAPSETHSITLELGSGAADVVILVYVWNETAIDAMTGTEISWADGVTWNKISWGYVTIQDTAQTATESQTASNAAAQSLTVTWTSGSTTSDRAMLLGVSNSANRPIEFPDAEITSRLFYTLADYSARVGSGAGGNGIAVSADINNDGFANSALAGMGLLFTPVAAGAVTIDTFGAADLNIAFDDEILVEIDGTGFGATQGAGAVTLNDTDPETTTPGTTVAQTVTAWSDTKITVTIDRGALSNEQVWLGVSNNSAQSASKQVTVKAAVPSLIVARTTPATQEVAVGQAFNFDMSNYFYSGDSQDRLVFSIANQPSGVTITSAGLISGVIAEGESASSPFTTTVTATDRSGNTVDDSFTWTVGDSTPAGGGGGATDYSRRGAGLMRGTGRVGRR